MVSVLPIFSDQYVTGSTQRSVDMNLVRAFWSDDSGQDLIEYGLIASLVSVVAIGAIGDFGLATAKLWQKIVAGLPA